MGSAKLEMLEKHSDGLDPTRFRESLDRGNKHECFARYFFLVLAH